jgi:hypothetical protein
MQKAKCKTRQDSVLHSAFAFAFCVSIPAVSGIRLVIGVVVMGILLPIMLFLLLGLTTASQLFTLSAAMLLTWGVIDVLAGILERPRLKGRSPQQALKEDWERRERRSTE